jgi:hypothetical protein
VDRIGEARVFEYVERVEKHLLIGFITDFYFTPLIKQFLLQNIQR